MDKIANKDAQKIYDTVANKTHECTIFEYGTEKLPIKIYNHISMADIDTIVKLAIGTAYSDGTYSHIKRESVVAMCVIKYLTDLPMPVYMGNDGEEIDDYLMAYQIVFGKDGLINADENSWNVITKIEECIDKEIDVNLGNYTPVAKLCNRIIDFLSETSAVLEDLMNSPEIVETFNELSELIKIQDTSKN